MRVYLSKEKGITAGWEIREDENVGMVEYSPKK